MSDEPRLQYTTQVFKDFNLLCILDLLLVKRDLNNSK